MNILLIPLGSAGDVHPFVGLGLALRARGHDVTLITGAYFEDLVRRLGMKMVPLGTAEEFETGINDPDLWHPRRGLELIVRKSLLPALAPVY